MLRDKNGKIIQLSWNKIDNILTYNSWDSTVYTGIVNTSIDCTNYLSEGMKLKFTQESNAKYAFITKVTSTQLTLFLGTDYTLTNAAITDIYFSIQKSPYGFPLDPNKWSIIVSNTANHLYTPSGNGILQDSGISIKLGICIWDVTVDSIARTSINASEATNINVGLAFNNNTSTNIDAAAGEDIPTSGGWTFCPRFHFNKILDLNTTTIYKLYSWHQSGGTLKSDCGIPAAWFPTTVIRATCAYL